jgi:tRNA threonylcarbamoyladenosine biosynthesis protein TsaE
MTDAPDGSSTQVPLPTRRATIKLARALAPALEPGDLVVCDGPLGVGKTFFVRALCRGLGLPESQRVTSPTFSLVQEFPTSPPLVHADVYRLGSDFDVEELGLRPARGEGAVVIVEWGLPYVELLGGDAVVISFKNGPRRAELRGTGPRSARVVAGVARAIEPDAAR